MSLSKPFFQQGRDWWENRSQEGVKKAKDKKAINLSELSGQISELRNQIADAQANMGRANVFIDEAANWPETLPESEPAYNPLNNTWGDAGQAGLSQPVVYQSLNTDGYYVNDGYRVTYVPNYTVASVNQTAGTVNLTSGQLSNGDSVNLYGGETSGFALTFEQLLEKMYGPKKTKKRKESKIPWL